MVGRINVFSLFPCFFLQNMFWQIVTDRNIDLKHVFITVLCQISIAKFSKDLIQTSDLKQNWQESTFLEDGRV